MFSLAKTPTVVQAALGEIFQQVVGARKVDAKITTIGARSVQEDNIKTKIGTQEPRVLCVHVDMFNHFLKGLYVHPAKPDNTKVVTVVKPVPVTPPSVNPARINRRPPLLSPIVSVPIAAPDNSKVIVVVLPV